MGGCAFCFSYRRWLGLGLRVRVRVRVKVRG